MRYKIVRDPYFTHLWDIYRKRLFGWKKVGVITADSADEAKEKAEEFVASQTIYFRA